MKTIAITGVGGELGSFLIPRLQNLSSRVVDLYHTHPAIHAHLTDHIALNLLESDSINTTLTTVNPDIVIHLAGITHIDVCEVDRVNGQKGNVWRTNVTATEEIAQYCASHNAHLIYLSTECVFGGQQKEYFESDTPSPKNWYGITKATAEQSILKSGASCTILRAVIAYAEGGKNTLWQKISSGLEKNIALTMANNTWMTPTYLEDLATVINLIIRDRKSGTYHITPRQRTTPFRFAQKISTYLGYSKEMISPGSLAEVVGKQKAKLRLKYACLNSQKTQKDFGLQFMSIADVVNNI